MNSRGSLSSGIYVLVGIAILILILVFWIKQGEKTKTHMDRQLNASESRVYQELIGSRPMASACRRWIAEGLGLPQFMSYYRIREYARDTGFTCCQSDDYSKCLDACATIVDLARQCAEFYSIMESRDGDRFTSPEICYRAKFDEVVQEKC